MSTVAESMAMFGHCGAEVIELTLFDMIVEIVTPHCPLCNKPITIGQYDVVVGKERMHRTCYMSYE